MYLIVAFRLTAAIVRRVNRLREIDRMVLGTRNSALHSPAWVLALNSYLKRQDFDARAQLAEAGFPDGVLPDPDTKVPFGNIAQFFELCAAATGDNTLGFRFGTQIDVRDAGLIAFVGINAPTLRDGLKNTAAYARVFGDAIEFDTSEFDSRGHYKWSYHLPPSVPRRQYVEWYASGCVSTLRHITGTKFNCVRVRFIHPRKSNIAEFEKYFGCPVMFSEKENSLTFSKRDMDLKIVNADEKLMKVLQKIANEVLKGKLTNAPAIQEEVERAVLALLPSGDASMERVANDMGLSVRTLSRRLADVELSYRKLVDNLRSALAERYLKESNLSITQIAFLLGYADTSAFVTSFKRITGQTPSGARLA